MSGQIIRFLLVGVINTIVGLSFIYFFLNIIHLNYWLSTAIGNGIGLLVSYFLNRRFTFESVERIRHTMWKFILVFLFSYLAAYWIGHQIAKLLVHWIPNIKHQYETNIAVLIGAGLYTILNYTGHRFFTFRRKEGRLRSPRII